MTFSKLSRRFPELAALAALLATLNAWSADPVARWVIDAGKSVATVSPTMHGIFFEDINYGADGGLYAELVQNRSFEHADSLFAWSTVKRDGEGDVEIASNDPLNPKNPHFLRVTVRQAGQGFGIANTGYDGMAVKQGENYLFSIRARCESFAGALIVMLEGEKGEVLGQCRVDGLAGQWRKFEGVIKSTAAAAKARLLVLASAPGRVDLDMVSLFPENTWNKRRNGLRADLVQTLADMKPGFLRFPGGCIVEGKDLANAYRWKDTIGDIAERPENWNRWMNAQKKNDAPQYYQTYGLGFFEFFQLCEDIGAEPVPIINCGMSCQYQDKQLVPLDQLDPWVRDALDLIEFANGPATSEWGAKRAAMGHPEPFKLQRLGVGNEQWGTNYFPRYLVFQKAIKAKYPGIMIVTTSGPGVDDQWWTLAWGRFNTGTPAEIVDEHYYRPPRWFYDNSERYDLYHRTGTKVFAGEFAAHDNGRRNNLRCALAEAAFMTGLLRNADLVTMSSYAPLFARAGFTQWSPDLIWFDSTRIQLTPSYHVQAMYGRNRPDTVLASKLELPGGVEKPFAGRFGVGTWNTQAEFKDIEVTKGGQTVFRADFSKGLEGWSTTNGKWEIVDGTLRQTAIAENAYALAGDAAWSDYTVSLKARKLAGSEGFLVLFDWPEDNSTTWWNLGGWRNTEHGLDIPGLTGPRVRGKIETNRWYDVRVELAGPAIKCFLDGKLTQEFSRKPPRALYAVAGRDQSGEIILDVVNPTDRDITTEITLRGIRRLAGAKATVLTSKSQDDENTFDVADKVAPRQETVVVSGPVFKHAFPANSFTILRVKGER